MTILAMYYVVADFALLGQYFYYRGSETSGPAAEEEGFPAVPTEQSPLLERETAHDVDALSGRGFVDAENPTAPSKPIGPPLVGAPYTSSPPPHASTSSSSSSSSTSSRTAFMLSALYKISIVVLVCFVGVMGWYISSRSPHSRDGLSSSRKTNPTHPEDQPSQDTAPRLNFWGQFFGYLCAAFYLGSRIPQLLLNHRRKSTEGVSILFFIFCCIGNVTYALSIFAYEPRCVGAGAEDQFLLLHHHHHDDGGFSFSSSNTCGNNENWNRAYWRYILVDASWVIGSIGALGLDLAIFSQFWFYRGRGRKR